MTGKTCNCTHRFTDRVERVDFVESFFRNFASYDVVVLAKIENKTKQSTFRFVANLLGRTAALVCRLSVLQTTSSTD